MKPYTRVRLAEREEISCELAAGSRLRVMDRQLGRAPSTIGRELRRAERTEAPIEPREDSTSRDARLSGRESSWRTRTSRPPCTRS
jgi:IS30 family transposase